MIKKYIDVTTAVRQDILKVFKVSKQMVSYSLNFDPTYGMSDKAKRIRSYALQKGGVMMITSKEVETIHDNEGFMRQYFPNGAMLEINKNDGSGSIFHKGSLKAHFDNVLVSEIYKMQRTAASL